MTSNIVKTEKKIGKVTFFVCSSQSDTAKDTIDKKVEKMIMKDVGQNAENQKFR